MELKSLLETYYRNCRQGYSMAPKAERTIKNIKQTWDMFLKKFPLRYLDEVSEPVLRRFFLWGHTKRKWQPMTTISHRKNLSVFILWCKEEGYIKENPLKKIIKPRMPQRVPKHHTKEQVDMIREAIRTVTKTQYEEFRNMAIINTAALAGLRRGELISLRLEDINLESKQLLVRAETSKGRKERYVPITMTLADDLEKYLKVRNEIVADGCKELWVSAITKKALTTHGLTHIVNKISGIVGFKLKLHSLRHSYGTYMYSGSQDIKAVQENMGHSDLSTTMLYVNSLSKDKRDAAEMNPLNTM